MDKENIRIVFNRKTNSILKIEPGDSIGISSGIQKSSNDWPNSFRRRDHQGSVIFGPNIDVFFKFLTSDLELIQNEVNLVALGAEDSRTQGGQVVVILKLYV